MCWIRMCLTFISVSQRDYHAYRDYYFGRRRTIDCKGCIRGDKYSNPVFRHDLWNYEKTIIGLPRTNNISEANHCAFQTTITKSIHQWVIFSWNMWNFLLLFIFVVKLSAFKLQLHFSCPNWSTKILEWNCTWTSPNASSIRLIKKWSGLCFSSIMSFMQLLATILKPCRSIRIKCWYCSFYFND